MTDGCLTCDRNTEATGINFAGEGMDNMTGEVQHLDDEQEFYKSENNDEAFHDEDKDNTKKKKKSTEVSAL